MMDLNDPHYGATADDMWRLKSGLDKRSFHLRHLALRCMKQSRRGHVGSTFSLIEIMRVLYDDVAKYDVANPKWPDRDRIILSKGHGCIAQYVMLADKGFFPMEELDEFCTKDGMLGGHPSHKVSGIECATGALGHGLSIGIGMALAAKTQKRNSRVFVIMGDGEIQEGSVWEAAMCASKYKLDNLIAIIDYNKIQSAGRVEEIQPLEPLEDKWKAFGFSCVSVDGHNISAIKEKLDAAWIEGKKPRCLICHTTKGKGISFAENDPKWHHQSGMSDELFAKMETELGYAA